ncbi:hypothetical protein N7478_011491 [Penicillium angulare]|uniref:uncharacterized protein n=1 Tax=Penicillium angulare TaxID=116970 RepID=UPI002541E3D5|nr:uncharacterized protein N7478_011491 [Penicillium angulare]KAJ5263886.1 hypothetical protein N7478_011491 [Penicillium angulare]
MSDHWSHLTTKPTSTTPGYLGEIYSGETYRPKSEPYYGPNHQPLPETFGKAMSPTEVKYVDKSRWVAIKEASCGLKLATFMTFFFIIGCTIVIVLMAVDIIHVPRRDPITKTLNSTDVDWKGLNSTVTAFSKTSVVVSPPATAVVISELSIDDMGCISNAQVGFVTKVRPAPTKVVNTHH